ncbi:hypothetical protein MTR_4g110170 [Medicago truncatula]|uniref:Uncharacterized protein n=1 Tax=Medicago truncatula TaxID=3880 RepID=A0A072URT8_MEDTR|nr:hypothetical protein MTR_4g110170 [Medicago truncatula]
MPSVSSWLCGRTHVGCQLFQCFLKFKGIKFSFLNEVMAAPPFGRGKPLKDLLGVSLVLSLTSLPGKFLASLSFTSVNSFGGREKPVFCPYRSSSLASRVACARQGDPE